MPEILRANGVPWLVWLHRLDWRCEGCGASGRLPDGLEAGPFARLLGELKREHAGCLEGDARADMLRREGVGETLNPDRAEAQPPG